MPGRTIFLLLLALLLGGAGPRLAAQQAPERPYASLRLPGALPLQTFAPEAYPGEPDLWAAVTDTRGRLYLGNGEGVVVRAGGQFSGPIALPNASVVRGLARGADGRIYVGGTGEIGFLTPDARGRLAYASLMGTLPAHQRGFDDVWRVFAYGDDVFFYTYYQVMRWSPARQQMHVWQFAGMQALVPGTAGLFLQDMGTGALARFDGAAWQPVFSAPRLRTEPLKFIATGAGADTLFVTGRGLYRHAGGRLVPLPAVLGQERGNPWIYSVQPLPGGDLALATLYHGAVVVDAGGRVVRRITRASGLPDNTVLALGLDAHGGLWLCLERGLARADLAAGVTLYGESEGLVGAAYDLAQYQGSVYLAGLQRFARLPGTAAAPLEVLSDSTEEFAALAATPQGLFVASNRALRLYRDGRLRPIPGLRLPGDYPTALLRSRVDTTRFYVGFREGLALLTLRQGEWTFERLYPEIGVTPEKLVENPDGSLWMGTSHEGLVHVAFDGGQARPTTFGPGEGMPRLVVAPIRIGGEVVIYTARGLFRPRGNRVVPDSSALAALFDYQPRHFESLEADAQGNVWMVVDGVPGVARRAAAGYAWEPVADAFVRARRTSSLRALAGATWAFQPGRVVRVAAPGRTTPLSTYLVSVRRTPGDSLLYSGFGAARDPRLAPHSGLAFTVGTSRASDVQYRYRIDGVDRQWSDWTDEPHRVYSALPAGAHVFRAQARDRFGALSGEVTYHFRVQAPWYATPFAYVAYVLLGLLFVLGVGRGVIRLQRRRAEAQRRILAREVELWTREAEAQKKMLQHLNASLHSSNERLQELSEQKSHLLGIAAHDLKAPLTNIYSLADILLEEGLDGEMKLEFVEMIRQSARHMSHLIDDVLTSAASESGQVSITPVPTDLATITRAVVEHSLAVAARKGQHLAFHAPTGAGDFRVMGDELRLGEVVTNLVSNALKYSPPGGDISVHLDRDADWVYFFVRDSGPGLSAEDQEKLFQPFQRLSAQPTGGESSSGLGLYIVRQYVELHGGLMSVESVLGEGATFGFRLAALHKKATAAASPRRAVPESQV